MFRPANNPYQPNFNPPDVAMTTIRQAASALPASYALLSTYRRDFLSWTRLNGYWGNWAICSAAGALTLALMLPRRRTSDDAQKPSLVMLATMGLMIWLFPGVPIALSPKYQQTVEMGAGYLPVYIQYVGLTMLLVALFEVCRRLRPALRISLATTLVAANACVAFITYDTNRMSIERLDGYLQVNDRFLYESALGAGLGDPIPEGSTILATGYHVWLLDGPPHSAYFLAQHLKRKVYGVNSRPPAERRPLAEQLVNIPSPTWFLSDNCAGRGSGFVALSELDPAIDAPTESYPVRKFRVFLVGSAWEKATCHEPLAICAKSFGRLSDESADQQSVPLAELTPLSHGKDWAIFEGSFAESVDVQTLTLSEAAPATNLASNAARTDPQRKRTICKASFEMSIHRLRAETT